MNFIVVTMAKDSSRVRVRFAIYISLNQFNTQNLKKSLLYLLLIILNCPLVQFVLVCRRLCLEKLECVVCRNLDNLWLCLICGFVACKRYVKGHASEHWQKKQHQFAVEVGRERIWDYFRDLYVGEKSYSNSTDEIVDLHTRRLMSEVEIQQQRVVNACIHSLTNELDNIMWRQAKLAISEVI